jgi:YjbE family integral membrane protein
VTAAGLRNGNAIPVSEGEPRGSAVEAVVRSIAVKSIPAKRSLATKRGAMRRVTSVMDPSSLGDLGASGIQVLTIIWFDILLAGDNAVVIALACRSLSHRQRKFGVLLGAGVAIVLRILFTILVTYLMNIPFLKLAGSLALFWIAVQLLIQEDVDESKIQGSNSVWGAVRTIAIADIVMSLDNVLAIAAVAKGNVWLIIFGLAVSIPLIIGGATLLMSILARFPILVWAGAALLGWIAGELPLTDPAVVEFSNTFADQIGMDVHMLQYIVAGIGAAFVVAVGWLIMKIQGRKVGETSIAAGQDRPAE